MFSENLKTLRIKAGYSQEELANRLGVVRQTVSKWERGISVPDATTLISMADLFGVSTADLLGERITIVDEENKNELAIHLAKINDLLSEKNQRSKEFGK